MSKSRLNPRTAAWIKANADELTDLPHPDVGGWTSQDVDFDHRRINKLKAKGVIKKQEERYEGNEGRCVWFTPQYIRDRIEDTLRKHYDYTDVSDLATTEEFEERNS